MRQPRIDYFDPAAKGHELKSPMDEFPAIETPKPKQPADRSPELVPTVPDVPVPVTGRRKIKRREPFDIYEDQDAALRRLALEDRMRDGIGSKSAMVREALDDYLAKIKA